jgi:hypothetical protein
MATMDSRRNDANALEFADTRPTLYFSAQTWAHLSAAHGLSRSAANEPAVVGDALVIRWVDLSAGPAQGADADADRPAQAADAALEPRAWRCLAGLAGLAVLAVGALAMAGLLMGPDVL